jgi:hypothetical protein
MGNSRDGLKRTYDDVTLVHDCNVANLAHHSVDDTHELWDKVHVTHCKVTDAPETLLQTAASAPASASASAAQVHICAQNALLNRWWFVLCAWVQKYAYCRIEAAQ